MTHPESIIQRQAVTWFRYQHPAIARLLFAVPNGGRRDRVTAAILKAEGVVAGVSDLILFVPSKGYHALCIEMKTPKGTQTDAQKEWEPLVKKQGYAYVVCRSLDEFIELISNYLIK